MYIYHNVLFSGDYISAFRGCCPFTFLHTLEIDQGLLAHTHKGFEGTPKNFNRENLKLGLEFNVLGSLTSGLIGSILMKLSQSTCRQAGVIKCVQFLEGPPPNI